MRRILNKKAVSLLVALILIILISVIFAVIETRERGETLDNDNIDFGLDYGQTDYVFNQDKVQDEAEELLWKNRTVVKISDARIGDRFLITPLGISLDAKSLPDETRYSIQEIPLKNNSVYFEYGNLDTSHIDRCFGSLALVEFDSEIDVKDERITFSVLNELSQKKGSGVKKIGNLKFLHFDRSSGICRFSLNDETGLYKEILDMFIDSISTAEVL